MLNEFLNGNVLRSKEKSLPAPDGVPEETPNSSLSSYPVGESISLGWEKVQWGEFLNNIGDPKHFS